MFNHKNFALQGLFPGLVSTRSVANLGHFEIEVIIEPTGGGGGGFYQPFNLAPTKYKIKIRVSRKGKTWEYEQVVSSTTAKVVAKVLNKKLAEPTISILSKSMVEHKEPEIKVVIK